MARGHLQSARAAMATPQMGWCPTSGACFDDEPTKKVPEYLLAVARSFDDDLLTDVDALPISGVATHTLEALRALEATELTGAFESIDSLESARPAPPNATAYQSGIVPAGTSLSMAERAQREVIPPPPRKPYVFPPALAFAETLQMFAHADLPFHAKADNEQIVAQPTLRSATTRAAISRSVASAVLAGFALFVLFVVGGRPLVGAPSVARTAITLRTHADRSDASGTVLALRGGVASPLATPTVVAHAAHFETRRAAVRVKKAQPPAGGIVRTSPF